MDNGVFKFRNFGKKTRSEIEIQKTELNINKLLKLDDWTMPID